MDEVLLTTDELGRSRVVMNRFSPRGELDRVFTVVDRRTGNYRAVKLTGDVLKDAKKLARLYKKLVVRDRGRSQHGID